MFIILMSGDSTAIDSVEVYIIPEIICFGFEEKSVAYSINASQNITPGNYDSSLADALFYTPLFSMQLGCGQLNMVSKKGQNPNHTTLLLNNHRIDNPLFGFVDITKLPVQFLENVSLSKDYSGSEGINLTTKLNHYDQPFSYVKFATGAYGMNLYNIDFTRPITNGLGFYVSGLYWESQRHRMNSHFKISSLYSNLYYNQIIPMRFDIVYFSNSFGRPGSDIDSLDASSQDNLLDVCLVCGNNNHKIVLYYTNIDNDNSDSISGYMDKNDIKNYGIEINNYHDLKGYEILYRLAGVLNKIDSDQAGSHSLNSISLLTTVNKSINDLVFSLSNRSEYANTEEFYYAPKVLVGFNFIDSTYLIGAVSRNYRTPSLSEIYSTETVEHYYSTRGNGDLLTEYYWSQEIGIKRKNFGLTLYKFDYDNFVVLEDDGDGYYTPRNKDSWQTIGIENYCNANFCFGNNRDTTSIIEIAVGFSGNYLLKGDSLPHIPKGNSSIFLSLMKNSSRFSTGLMLKEEFVSQRFDIAGQEMEHFRIFSAVGTVRFMTLSLTLAVNNIFDENYSYMPYYSMELRNLSFSVKWEFWD